MLHSYNFVSSHAVTLHICALPDPSWPWFYTWNLEYLTLVNSLLHVRLPQDGYQDVLLILTACQCASTRQTFSVTITLNRIMVTILVHTKLRLLHNIFSILRCNILQRIPWASYFDAFGSKYIVCGMVVLLFNMSSPFRAQLLWWWAFFSTLSLYLN